MDQYLQLHGNFKNCYKKMSLLDVFESIACTEKYRQKQILTVFLKLDDICLHLILENYFTL